MPITIDEHGQTEDPRIMFRIRADRLINEMLGVVKCSLSDGKVSPEEAAYLHDWLAKNPDVAYGQSRVRSPGAVIIRKTPERSPALELE